VLVGDGEGHTVEGGALNMVAGNVLGEDASDLPASGGSLTLKTGYSQALSSGALSLLTANSGSEGQSGSLTIASGTSSSGQVESPPFCQ
jgi:hypothetical protein